MAQWKNGYTVIAICITLIVLAALMSFVITVRNGTDPDVFFRFLAGPTVGAIISTVSVILVTVVNRKVNKMNDTVKAVQENTNGNTSALLRQIQIMTKYMAEAEALPPHTDKDEK